MTKQRAGDLDALATRIAHKDGSTRIEADLDTYSAVLQMLYHLRRHREERITIELTDEQQAQFAAIAERLSAYAMEDDIVTDTFLATLDTYVRFRNPHRTDPVDERLATTARLVWAYTSYLEQHPTESPSVRYDIVAIVSDVMFKMKIPARCRKAKKELRRLFFSAPLSGGVPEDLQPDYEHFLQNSAEED